MRNFPRPADQCTCCRISGCCRLQSPANIRYNSKYTVPWYHTMSNKPPPRGQATLQSGVRLWWWCQMDGQSVQLEPAQLRQNWGNKSSDLKLAPLHSPALRAWSRGGVVAALSILLRRIPPAEPAI